MVGHRLLDLPALAGAGTLPYFDYDLKIADLPQPPLWQDCLREFADFVSGFMAARYGHDVKVGEGDFGSLAVTSACTPRKVSFHVVVLNVFVRDRREFVNQLRAYHADQADNLSDAMQTNPDPAPYGRTQDFRLTHCRKDASTENTLLPILFAHPPSGAGVSYNFAVWPNDLAAQIVHGMVCEVGPSDTELLPLAPVPERRARRWHMGGGGAAAGGNDDEAPQQACDSFAAAVLEVLGAWEESAFGSRTYPSADHWLSNEELYLRNGTCGWHQCPHGCRYHSNNFLVPHCSETGLLR